MPLGIRASQLLLASYAPVTVFPPTRERPLVVTFTGTATLSDVYDDVRCFTRPWPDEESVGLVHGGFAQRMLRLCDDKLMHTLKHHPTAVLAGHSAGAACAVLLASLASHNDPRARFSVYSYGAPRIGNQAFCEAYRRQGMWDRTWRYSVRGDPVTRVPPWLRHVGVEVPLSSSGNALAKHSLGEYARQQTGDMS